MKTKKELNELSNEIGKAIFAYHNAIAENLKEGGKEYKVNSFDDDEDGLQLTINGRHNDLVEMMFDKVRYNKGRNLIETHVIMDDYEKCDYWLDVAYLGDDADYIFDNIDWEEDE